MGDTDTRKPTEYSELMFGHAANTAFPGIIQKNGLSPKETADVLHKIAGGLEGIAIGLRATYILLGEVKQLMLKKP